MLQPPPQASLCARRMRTSKDSREKTKQRLSRERGGRRKRSAVSPRLPTPFPPLFLSVCPVCPPLWRRLLMLMLTTLLNQTSLCLSVRMLMHASYVYTSPKKVCLLASLKGLIWKYSRERAGVVETETQ